jgi:hypothetical protein
VETIHYLQNLPLYQLFWLIATLVIGVSFSLRNYVLYFISIFHGSYSQNTLGKAVDWVWLTSAITLCIINL